MSKHKKTKQAKKIADTRRLTASSLPTSSTKTPVFTQTSLVKEQPIIPMSYQSTTKPMIAQNYAYVLTDLSRTLILTGALITIELILFFLQRYF